MSKKICERTGFSAGGSGCACEVIWPNGATLADGLTEEEAVVVALWNNGPFQEALTELGIARGDLIQAGLLPNPEIAYFFEVPSKPFKYAIEFPLESLWLRPIRVAAASRESGRVCDRLTQLGLDLIRDVRQAFADALLADGRLAVAKEAVRIREQIASLADARLQSGDVSPQEVATARIDSFQANQDLVRTQFEVKISLERLKLVLGIGSSTEPISLIAPPALPRLELDAEALVNESRSNRPDALAASTAIDAAEHRVQLAKAGWVRFGLNLDASSGRNTGHEFGPAFRATLPIFNWNQGNIARAEAELERAHRQAITIRNQIVLDVRQSLLRFAQARAELALLEEKTLPEVNTAIRRAEIAYREGSTPYVVVLETTRQLLDSRVRQEQLTSDVRRAWAELERSVGRHIVAPRGIETVEVIATP